MVRKLRNRNSSVNINILIFWEILWQHYGLVNKFRNNHNAIDYLSKIENSNSKLGLLIENFQKTFGKPKNYNKSTSKENLMNSIDKYSIKEAQKYYLNTHNIVNPELMTSKYNIDKEEARLLYSLIITRFFVENASKEVKLPENIVKELSKIKRSLTILRKEMEGSFIRRTKD